MEEWKEIFPDYLVSTLGNVDSLKRGKRHRLKPRANTDGYLRVAVWIDNKAKDFAIHRLVALAFIPNSEGKREVNHINGIKTDNRVENLEWATHTENIKHAIDLRLFKTKLTDEQVIQIRENCEALSGAQLAKKFNVRPATICRIQLGQSYKSIEGTIRNEHLSDPKRVSDVIRAQVRSEYQYGIYGCGQQALAKKYNVSQTTIYNIVHGK